MRSRRVAVTLSLVLVVQVLLGAQSTQIKLATFVPAQSVWDKALRQMGTDWRRSTDGRVTLTIFSGGSQGIEANVVRRMRINQLQAAAFTPIGLAEIDEAFGVFGIPFFFESDEELYYVLKKLTPTLKERLEQKGFVLLNWGHGGWVHVFTTTPVKSMNDLKKVKLFTSAGGDKLVQWYKTNGFRPVALALNDVLMGLQTGLIEAYPSPPYLALLVQWYRSTPYMLDIALGPAIGATVMTRRAWDRLDEGDRTRVLEAALRAEERLATEVPKQDEEAIVAMERRALTVTHLENPAVEAGVPVNRRIASPRRGEARSCPPTSSTWPSANEITSGKNQPDCAERASGGSSRANRAGGFGDAPCPGLRRGVPRQLGARGHGAATLSAKSSSDASSQAAYPGRDPSSSI